MYNSIPGKPRIIHNNVYLPTPKVRGLGDKLLDVRVIEDVPRDGEGSGIVQGVVDGGCDGGGFFCFNPLAYPYFTLLFRSMVNPVTGEGDIPPSISAIITFAPSLANNRAVSAPMPWPAPVMMATWLASRPWG